MATQNTNDAAVLVNNLIAAMDTFWAGRADSGAVAPEALVAAARMIWDASDDVDVPGHNPSNAREYAGQFLGHDTAGQAESRRIRAAQDAAWAARERGAWPHNFPPAGSRW